MAMAAFETATGPWAGLNLNGMAMPAADALRVLLVDAYPMFRRGLAEVLGAERAFLCVGESDHGADAVRVAPALRPDVVVIAHQVPAMDGIATIEALRRVVPAARFVLLVGELDPTEMRRAVTAGATCILPKTACSQELVTAVRAADRGQRLYPAALTDALVAGARSAAIGADLTERERKLLALMARGMANLQIAQALNIAIPTVKFHVTNILNKLQVENRTAAVLVALRHKIVELA